MRALVRLAVLAVAVAGVSVAHAADISTQNGAGAWLADRAVPYTIFDYEPGVFMRDYWSTPWGARRYFPVTGKIPVSGRHEDLDEVGDYQPAQSFYRSWSTSRPSNELLPPRPQPVPPISK